MTSSTTHRVILDCDPGNGIPATDVDDGLALGLLLASPSIRIEAVTIVTGNTHRDVGYTVARTMLDEVGVEVPVHPGAAQALVEPPDRWSARRETERVSNEARKLWRDVPAPRRFDLPHHLDAAAEIVRRVSAEPGEITLVAVGPLTNIAHALQLRPAIAHEIKRLVIMGGAFHVPTHLQELNFGVDPEAARAVLRSGANITLVPLDVTLQTSLTLDDLARLDDVPTRLANYLVSTTAPWIRYGMIERGRDGCPLHDPLAAALLLDTDLVETVSQSVDVQLHGAARSRPLRWKADSTLFAPGMTVPDIPEALVAVSVDNTRLLDVLISALSQEGLPRRTKG